jgi:hypothetical protein
MSNSNCFKHFCIKINQPFNLLRDFAWFGELVVCMFSESFTMKKNLSDFLHYFEANELPMRIFD